MPTILIVNPNTTADQTDDIADIARSAAGPETDIAAVTAPFGAAYIGTRSESAVASHAVLDAIASYDGAWDAAVIASSSDSGLAGARELFERPVTAMTEASMLTACLLGDGFSYIGLQARSDTMFRSLVSSYGMTTRLKSVRLAGALPGGRSDDPDALFERLEGAARLAVEEDLADVVLLGGSAASRRCGELSARLGVPVIDGVTAAVSMAEHLIRLGVRTGEAGSYGRAPERKVSGVSAPLAGLFGAGHKPA